MASRGKAVTLGALAILIAGAGLYLVFAPQPSDDQLIREALARSIKASREGRPGGVLDLLSNSVSVNGTEYSSSRQIASAIRRYKPDVTVVSPQPVVRGDSATITSPVNLSVLTRSIQVNDVVFQFQREDTTRLLVIPAKAWKLREVTVPETAIEQVAGQFEQ